MKIEGTVAIVTGGASGLGEATVKSLVKAGCKVVIADVGEEKGKALAESLGDDKALFIKTDVTDEEAVQNLVKKTVEKFGGVHIVVNSAGVVHLATILSQRSNVKEFTRVLAINVIGTFNVTKAASAVMVKQPVLNDKGERGIIINTASVAGIEGQSGFAIYGGSKGAVIGMTLPLARDLGKFGIRVLAIAPSVFITPMGHQLNPAQLEFSRKVVALGRLGDPEEFADACMMCCKNSYLTGAVIRLDGGQALPHL